VGIIGDLPIYVAWDSADVWNRRELFLLSQK
jgi:4-alpha-glucanotransferase